MSHSSELIEPGELTVVILWSIGGQSKAQVTTWTCGWHLKWRAVLWDWALYLGTWCCLWADSVRIELNCRAPAAVQNCLVVCGKLSPHGNWGWKYRFLDLNTVPHSLPVLTSLLSQFRFLLSSLQLLSFIDSQLPYFSLSSLHPPGKPPDLVKSNFPTTLPLTQAADLVGEKYATTLTNLTLRHWPSGG